jgi:hypothetical protein
VRFLAEHRYVAPIDAVTAVLVDPAFHRQLELPDLELLEVVDSHTDGNQSVLRLRYDFVGHLDPMARRLLGPGRRLTWVQDLRLDRASGAGRLSFEADADPRRLHGAADVVLAPDDGGTVRRLDGDLVVAVPLIGTTAERRIVPGLLRRLDIEAAALDERLRGP